MFKGKLSESLQNLEVESENQNNQFGEVHVQHKYKIEEGKIMKEAHIQKHSSGCVQYFISLIIETFKRCKSIIIQRALKNLKKITA